MAITEASPVGTSPIHAKISFIEWGPVLAGAFLAAALSFVLLTFGTAIGLSATSPWPGSGVSAKVLASLAVFWVMAQQIGAFMVGGYVAGRMRSRWHEANQDEVEFRDGLHGGLVWAVGIVIGAAMLLATAGAVARTGAEVAGKTAAAVASTTNPMDLTIDTLLRPMTLAQASTAPQGSTAGASTPSAGTPPAASRPVASNMYSSEMRSEISRILTRSTAAGEMSAPDRAYLAQIVAQRAGISQPEAEKRVTDAITAAREAADKARRGAILTGFVTAASLIISLAAAWWAGLKGGNHRDNAVPARFNFVIPRRS
jgi:hypothetical protein